MLISDWSSDGCSSDLHPAGAENERFDDEGGGFAIRFWGGAGGFERGERGLFHAFVREGDGVDVEQQGLPGTVVDAALADRHRADRVAVIAMLEDENAVARLADVEPIAERHLERDLDAGRARVREEGASRSEEHTSELQSLMRISTA